MKKLCVISMLVLGIVSNALCQKSRVDTVVIFRGSAPPTYIYPNNGIASSGSNELDNRIKKNVNEIIIHFGNVNTLRIDYEGEKTYRLKQNIDSLLANFWNDYQKIRDTVNKNMVKKITYYGKSSGVNNKSIIDVQYFPQKEVFQFGKEVELVRLKQDTLILVNYALESNIMTINGAFKTYNKQNFLFKLNSIDDVEEVMDFGVNQAIIEAGERVENERKIVKPWKLITVSNDLLSQKIRSYTSRGALFDYINFHGDLGIGLDDGRIQSSLTVAFDIVASKYYRKGIVLGAQGLNTLNVDYKKSINLQRENEAVFFTGISFYQKNNNKNQFKGSVLFGYYRIRQYYPSVNFPGGSTLGRLGNGVKLFGWYQITPLLRMQIDVFELYSIKSTIPSVPYSGKILNFGPALRLSLGF